MNKIGLVQIIGGTLIVTGIITFGFSIKFIEFSMNQLIHVQIFEDGFFQSFLNTGTALYYGDAGFSFFVPIKTPIQDTNAFDVPEEQYSIEETNIFRTYLHELSSEDQEKIYFDAEHDTIRCNIPHFQLFGLLTNLTSIMQIFLSIGYVFWKPKNIPIMSFFFYSYLLIYLVHLTSFCAIFNSMPNKRVPKHIPIEDPKLKYFYRRSISDIFVGIVGINCFFILIFTILTCFKCDTENYSDHCIDKETYNRSRSQSTGVMLSSTDQLNK